MRRLARQLSRTTRSARSFFTARWAFLDIDGDDVVAVRQFCALANLQGRGLIEGEADSAARFVVAGLPPRSCKASGIREGGADGENQSLLAWHRAHQLTANQHRAEHDGRARGEAPRGTTAGEAGLDQRPTRLGAEAAFAGAGAA